MSHQVVSVSSREEFALTALAQPSGPSLTSTSRQPVNGPSSLGTAGGGGVTFAGGGPTAPGCFGPFTTCLPNQHSLLGRSILQTLQSLSLQLGENSLHACKDACVPQNGVRCSRQIRGMNDPYA